MTADGVVPTAFPTDAEMLLLAEKPEACFSSGPDAATGRCAIAVLRSDLLSIMSAMKAWTKCELRI
jgi:hypothetical protein